jgi:hypothetical protein
LEVWWVGGGEKDDGIRDYGRGRRAEEEEQEGRGEKEDGRREGEGAERRV